MNILLRVSKEEGKTSRHIVVLFGLGVVGGSIREHLILHNFKIVFAPFMHWGNKECFQKDLLGLNNFLMDLFYEKSTVSTSFNIVWAAGKAGFNSSEDDTVGEWINYSQTVSMFRSNWGYRLSEDSSFYFVSSAGGLFEGQKIVGHYSQPSPTRPYGLLKKRQEEILKDDSLPFKRYIYRPSSIYGYIEPSKRMGLIPTLLFNGIRYAPSRIIGNNNTLRDYISSDDVGDFMCNEILSSTPEATEKPVFLVSGKPTSILEIKVLIEHIIGRKLFISYDLNQTNYLDNTFSVGDLPKGLQSVELGAGIYRVYSRFFNANKTNTN